MHTCSGGLGILAGDFMRSAADQRIPMVGMTLLHRKGYVRQRFDDHGWQIDEPDPWPIEQFLQEMPARATVTLEGRTVYLRAWRYTVGGATGHTVPVYFLDTDLPENSPWDRALTHWLYGGLYGGDPIWYGLCQEVVLGIGGVRMLRALGYRQITRFHLNEGHASFLTLELLAEQAACTGKTAPDADLVRAVRQRCVFSTHTPVEAGHDKFLMSLVRQALGPQEVLETMREEFCQEDRLNMTLLGCTFSDYINGVARSQRGVAKQILGFEIDAISNGVHAGTWTAPHFQRLYDQHMPEWRLDNFLLRHGLRIPTPAVWEAHRTAKRDLLDHVNRLTAAGLEDEAFTVGFARRATEYKRAYLLLEDLPTLQRLSAEVGRLQVIFAGRAHPRDQKGKAIIAGIHAKIKDVSHPNLTIIYLANYDIALAKLLVSGVDVWLNTPQPPLEASGTSGMKAALNGVPSLSILDGWWIDGSIEGGTGWAIGEAHHDLHVLSEPEVAALLYEKLGQVMALFYRHREQWIQVMRQAIALNGSYFHTHRMLLEYLARAYRA
jgi:starch phosphorylase